MRHSTRAHPLARAQAGASLVITLVILSVLMIMGVTAVLVSNTQLRMAGNIQFQNLALSNAESALASAEYWLPTHFNDAGFTARVPGGLYPAGTAPDPLTMAWDDTTSVKLNTSGSQRYLIEQVTPPPGRVLPSNSIGNCNVYGMSGPCPRVYVYRLTARGTSAIGASKVVQSVFAVRVNI
jgi:Tfp pilus assembly protein PilX